MHRTRGDVFRIPVTNTVAVTSPAAHRILKGLIAPPLQQILHRTVDPLEARL